MPRKNDLELLRQLEAQRKALELRAAAIRARQRTKDRKEDTRRKIILGGALLAWMRERPAETGWMRDLIESKVTRDADRKLLAELLEPPPGASEEKTKAAAA